MEKQTVRYFTVVSYDGFCSAVEPLGEFDASMGIGDVEDKVSDQLLVIANKHDVNRSELIVISEYELNQAVRLIKEALK